MGLLTVLIALLVAITIHEFSHAYISFRLGDDTAKQFGRISLNPFAHLDIFGTLFLILVGIGWGKPVPINPNNLKNPIRDELIIALAGPFSNIALALTLSLVVLGSKNIISAPLLDLLTLTGFYNILLALFNLLPIPPLDGSKIIAIFSSRAYIFLQTYGIYILLALLFLPIGGYNIVDLLIYNPSSYIFKLLF